MKLFYQVERDNELKEKLTSDEKDELLAYLSSLKNNFTNSEKFEKLMEKGGGELVTQVLEAPNTVDNYVKILSEEIENSVREDEEIVVDPFNIEDFKVESDELDQNYFQRDYTNESTRDFYPSHEFEITSPIPEPEMEMIQNPFYEEENLENHTLPDIEKRLFQARERSKKIKNLIEKRTVTAIQDEKYKIAFDRLFVEDEVFRSYQIKLLIEKRLKIPTTLTS